MVSLLQSIWKSSMLGLLVYDLRVESSLRKFLDTTLDGTTCDVNTGGCQNTMLQRCQINKLRLRDIKNTKKKTNLLQQLKSISDGSLILKSTVIAMILWYGGKESCRDAEHRRVILNVEGFWYEPRRHLEWAWNQCYPYSKITALTLSS